MIVKWFGRNYQKSQVGVMHVCGEGNIKNIMLTRQTARRTGPKGGVWRKVRSNV
jgi:hypothetical protein